jgi:hypothetical protein
MGIKDDWRIGMSYEELHNKYGPWGKCECAGCEAKRAQEVEAELVECTDMRCTGDDDHGPDCAISLSTRER